MSNSTAAVANGNGAVHSSDVELQQRQADPPSTSKSTVRLHYLNDDAAPAPGNGAPSPLDTSSPRALTLDAATVRTTRAQSIRSGRLKRAGSFLEDEANVQTVLVWQNLTVTTPVRGSKNGVKKLLDNVSGSMTGGIWAVMGPSGCGQHTQAGLT